MVKCYVLLILLCSIIFVKTKSDCDGIAASSTNECVDKFSQEDRDGGYYCCFAKAKKNGVSKSECMSLIEEEVDDLDNYIGLLEEQGYTDVSVNCKSFYLQLGLLSLLLILL